MEGSTEVEDAEERVVDKGVRGAMFDELAVAKSTRKRPRDRWRD
jgi:hypothetical protein